MGSTDSTVRENYAVSLEQQIIKQRASYPEYFGLLTARKKKIVQKCSNLLIITLASLLQYICARETQEAGHTNDHSL